ncbi:DUF1682 domain-containing protein [Fibrivirga algicola]|uniref:DUF1682 domain-containing protein n=1 Tax=Fibrivirga algicola TaxID=2950420 RepID=A0ABX0QFC8_9BACT|nr:DUF1682 domain-containing protein [Fibrivirga algicola]NID09936.1 DUF1682 domain-containing protein [Fibrivirga algicola]
MKTRFLAAVIVATLVSVGAFAQTEKPRLSKEERVARREEMKAKLAAMTPEQREKAKVRLQARRERQGKKNG